MNVDLKAYVKIGMIEMVFREWNGKKNLIGWLSMKIFTACEMIAYT